MQSQIFQTKNLIQLTFILGLGKIKIFLYIVFGMSVKLALYIKVINNNSVKTYIMLISFITAHACTCKPILPSLA